MYVRTVEGSLQLFHPVATCSVSPFLVRSGFSEPVAHPPASADNVTIGEPIDPDEMRAALSFDAADVPVPERANDPVLNLHLRDSEDGEGYRMSC